MKYKVGDKVRIKSIDWYNKNKDKWGVVLLGLDIKFYPNMAKCCGKVLTIKHALNGAYITEEFDAFNWTDEMIEGLVEEETKSEDELLDEYEELTDRAFKGGYEKCKSDIELNGFQLPEGYIFKDENGNVINATKIVLEKKKPKYPQTYEECCKILGCKANHFFTNFSYNGLDIEISDYEDKIDDLLKNFRKLRYCRDAYWKLYGEEMGLGKPWEPDYTNTSEKKFSIWVDFGEIKLGGAFTTTQMVLSFPTEEMRDAFYENFKEEIESCKELL